jgi:hypothetical protein
MTSPWDGLSAVQRQQIREAHAAQKTGSGTLVPDDLDMLRSYADGPRIWDATSLLPAVYRLADQGLIELAPPEDDGSPPSRGAYRLTAAGRAVLAKAGQP